MLILQPSPLRRTTFLPIAYSDMADRPLKAEERAAAALFGGRRLAENAGSDTPATGEITLVENPERVDGGEGVGIREESVNTP